MLFASAEFGLDLSRASSRRRRIEDPKDNCLGDLERGKEFDTLTAAAPPRKREACRQVSVLSGEKKIIRYQRETNRG